MKITRHFICVRLGIMSLLLMLIFSVGAASPENSSEVNLVIDEKRVEASPPPVINNGRTLVPIRLVSESLGAVVDWDQENRTVLITKEDRSVKLRIDNRLIDYNKKDETTFGLSDVPPQIFQSRTFVPLRLVSNALGVTVDWESAKRTVYVDSNTPASFTPFFNVSLDSIQPGQAITGKTELSIDFNGSQPAGASEVRFLLLDPETGRGPIIARGNDINGSYEWLPDPVYSGKHVLAAAVYDSNNNFLTGKVVPMELEISPEVTLSGVKQQETINDTLDLNANLNFTAKYVKYKITNQDNGKTITTQESDPYGNYKWNPQLADNGVNSIQAIACSNTGETYYSPEVDVNIDVDRKLELKGVTPNSSVEKPVTLWLSSNFPLSQTSYLLRNKQTGEELSLKQTDGYSSFNWFPKPEQAGTWELIAKVIDNHGNTYYSDSITVEVPGKPNLLLKSVGPQQVITDTLELETTANVSLNKIEYLLISPDTDTRKVIASGSDKAYSWTPREEDEGNWRIQAVGTTSSGQVIESEAVPVRVYLGPTYESKPIVAKDKFLDFASEMARESQERTGMSAALQTAQAILETGWGQYTPVDKYSGKISNNMFGIKGTGPSGSVTSNTWEEYNGHVFHVDANFRAYSAPSDSWADHKKLLLEADRYQPYREVMHNSTQGAWALKRAGYATDSQYPIKLINIINNNNLNLIDETNI